MPVTPPIELAIAALRDKTLSAKALAFKIVVQCRRAVQLTTADAVTSGRAEGGDTPGLEGYLWSIWGWLTEVAMRDPSRHDFFAGVLAAVKAKYNQDTDWVIWGQPFDWANLPLWGPTVAETMNCGLIPIHDEEGVVVLIQPYDEKLGQSILAGDPAPDTPEGWGWARARTRWLNYNAFRARLWDLAVDEDPHWAMVMVARYLEPLSLPKDVWRSKPGDATFPRELGMETGMTWLRVAGARMFMCREVWGRDSIAATGVGGSRGTWKSVSGYHPDRWTHWKDILQALVGGEKGEWRTNVIEAAKSTLDAMEKAEVEARGLQS
ncbi:uncharacterized protein TRAVEDRAFT_19370 [Trametes versicolor FP-101664 SS1]|uniref:uncharacterized protein n=1 Tax=Trametes versicolor (strain FP-101664) TaxID=717944 RepID=UPI0004621F76|nr:uncharacterized protein TRAVEDRAFT_19370 [Trametes versicolor FP-101664 SS1]EIW60791.1 hypothetical protein TRAVEDRAFT_19370 [Trametes versicolor FP-101664 SS1]